MQNRFERLPDQAKIAGVCAGLAAYFGTSTALMRIIFLVGIPIPGFPALLLYAILWVVMPATQTALAGIFGTSQPQPPVSFMSSYNPKKSGSLVGGIVLIGIGVLFLLDRWFDIDPGDLWPFILIAVGVWVLFRDKIVKPGSILNPGPVAPGTDPAPAPNPTTPDRTAPEPPKQY